MTDEQMAAVPVDRDFSGSELAVLRDLKVDPSVARPYPERFGVRGVAELVAAGVPADAVRSIDPLLTPSAIVAFLALGVALDDTEYEERFFDAAMLADAGVSASMANAYPADFSEIDVVRLHDAGATPDDVASFTATWDPVDIARLVAAGVTAAEAEPFLATAFIPTESIATCCRAGVEPAALDSWLEVVAPAVRTESRILVSMALDQTRLDEPERFRDALLAHAIESVALSENAPADVTAVANALEQVVRRRGEISTTIPSSWNKQRILHVGPPTDEVAEVSVMPGQPIRFSYGDVSIGEGIENLEAYATQLGGTDL
ncbi:MAG: hypothetical protein ACR2P0_07995 [Acidimicrobiales bacterium]